MVRVAAFCSQMVTFGVAQMRQNKQTERFENSVSAGAALEDDDAGAVSHRTVEFENVLVQHPDAAGRCGLADAPRFIGPVNAIQRIPAIAIQIQCPCAERIVRTSGNPLRQARIAPSHVGCRRPARPLGSSANRCLSIPPLSVPTDRNAEADRPAAVFDVIQEPLLLVDQDCPGRLPARIGYILPAELLRNTRLVDKRNVEGLIWNSPDVPTLLRSFRATEQGEERYSPGDHSPSVQTVYQISPPSLIKSPHRVPAIAFR